MFGRAMAGRTTEQDGSTIVFALQLHLAKSKLSRHDSLGVCTGKLER